MKLFNVLFIFLFVGCGDPTENETETNTEPETDTETETETETDTETETETDGETETETETPINYETIDIEPPEIEEPACEHFLPDLVSIEVEEGELIIKISNFYFVDPPSHISVYGSGLPGITWDIGNDGSLTAPVEDDGMATFSAPLSEVREERIELWIIGHENDLEENFDPEIHERSWQWSQFQSLAVLNRLPRSQRQFFNLVTNNDGVSHCIIKVAVDIENKKILPLGNQQDFDTVCEKLPAPIRISSEGDSLIANSEYLHYSENAEIYIYGTGLGRRPLIPLYEEGEFTGELIYQFSDISPGIYEITLIENVEVGTYWPNLYRLPHMVALMEEETQNLFFCEENEFDRLTCLPRIELIEREDGSFQLLPAGNFLFD